LLIPSRRMCAAISDALQIDKGKMWKLVISDKIREKYGTVPLEIAGRNPELQPIERGWHYLSGAEKQILVDLVGVMAKRREASGSQSSRELRNNYRQKLKALAEDSKSVVGLRLEDRDSSKHRVGKVVRERGNQELEVHTPLKPILP
jgi:hypothetical protein